MQMDVSEGEKAATAAELAHQRTLETWARVVIALGAIASVGLSAYIIFGLGPILGWWVPLETQYFYMMLGFLLPIVFLMYPLAASAREYTPWYDILLAVLAFAIPIYFTIRGDDHAESGLGVQRSAARQDASHS